MFDDYSKDKSNDLDESDDEGNDLEASEDSNSGSNEDSNDDSDPLAVDDDSDDSDDSDDLDDLDDLDDSDDSDVFDNPKGGKSKLFLNDFWMGFMIFSLFFNGYLKINISKLSKTDLFKWKVVRRKLKDA